MSTQRGTTHFRVPSHHPHPTTRLQFRKHVPEVVVVCAVSVALLAFFLAIYKVKRYPMPIGYDTPRYLFQTTLVADLGVAHVPHVLPPPQKSLATRTGFPLIVLTLSSLFSTSTFKVGAAVPAATAAALALAAGVLVSSGLRGTSWDLGVVTLIVGASAVMVRLMVPETYTDNLMSAALLMAALLPIVSAIRGGPGMVFGMGVLGMSGVIHPQFFGLFVLMLGLVALAYGPASWRAWRRRDANLLDTPSVRLGVILAGASAVAAVALFGAVRSWPIGAGQIRAELLEKLRRDLPLYRFPLTVPLAVIGAGVLGTLGFRRSQASADRFPSSSGAPAEFVARFLLAVSFAWGLVTLIGVISFYMGSAVPAHRLLSFLIPLPLLMAVGILGLGRAMAARARMAVFARMAVGAAIVIAGIAVVGFLGYRDMYVNLPAHRGIEFLDMDKIRDAATARAYLERFVPEDHPVVFVIDDRGPKPLLWVPEMAYMIRSVLPSERILHSYVYVGDPNNYLAGKPTLRATPAQYNENLRIYWPTVQRVLARHPVALLLRSYNAAAYRRYVATHPGSEIAPSVALLAGPKPRVAIAAPSIPTGPRGGFQAGLLGVGSLVVLALVGVGWALAGLPRSVRPFEILALAPAVGIAALVAGGLVFDGFGIRLSGVGGAITPVLVAAGGLLLAWITRRARAARPLVA